MLKKVYITPFFQKNKFGKIVYSLNEEWFKYLNKFGFNTEILTPFNLEYMKLQKNYGVIISGGGDISKFVNNEQNILRDKFEIKIIKHCYENKIKIIGICRGMQLFASLYKCKFRINKKHIKKNNLQHKIKINKSFGLKTKYITVNSHHRYCLENTPNPIEQIGLANDKTIEIISTPKKIFLGLMFHPERKNINQKIVDKIVYRWLK